MFSIFQLARLLFTSSLYFSRIPFTLYFFFYLALKHYHRSHCLLSCAIFPTINEERTRQQHFAIVVAVLSLHCSDLRVCMWLFTFEGKVEGKRTRWLKRHRWVDNVMRWDRNQCTKTRNGAEWRFIPGNLPWGDITVLLINSDRIVSRLSHIYVFKKTKEKKNFAVKGAKLQINIIKFKLTREWKVSLRWEVTLDKIDQQKDY